MRLLAGRAMEDVAAAAEEGEDDAIANSGWATVADILPLCCLLLLLLLFLEDLSDLTMAMAAVAADADADADEAAGC